MRWRVPICIALASAVFLSAQLPARAQFKEEAFTQSYNDDPADTDSIATMFSFKEFFGGLSHKNELKIGTLFAGSTIFVGSSQIYNRQYWKLPVIYTGIAAGVGSGIYLTSQGRKQGSDHLTLAGNLCFAGAGLVWWASLMDGVVNYRPNEFPQPGRATLYSILIPGLGQVYNKEYWKIPIYWGGMIGAAHFYSLNKVNYERFRRIYKEATNPDIPYTGPISAETALYYRDVYRRYRDYSVVTFLGVYLLQIIDANVFAYMHDFEVSDDLTMSLSPAVICPDNALAFSPAPPAGVGMRIGFRF